MKIGFPIEVSGPGGIRSWLKTFNEYCILKGHEVSFSHDSDVDAFITFANCSSKEQLHQLKKKGAKIIYRMDGIFFKYLEKEVTLANNHIIDGIKCADKVIYQSYFAKHATSLLFDGKDVPGDIIYNGANPELFKPNGEILPKPKNKRIVLSIAYWGTPLMAEHSINSIIATARELLSDKNIEFWILGEAYPQTEELIKKANLKNITRYDLKTPIKHDEMPKFIRTSDIILHTRPNDACSNLIIEAMNIGIPVVGLNSGSTPELLGDAGLMASCKPSYEEFPTIDTKDMANKIQMTFKQYDLFKNKIRKRSELFTHKLMCQKYLELIEILTNSRGIKI